MISRRIASDSALATVVGLGVALTRIPFLSGSVYGLDPDAARIAAAGAAWIETGAYVPSRLPSYPLPEAAAAAIWSLGGGPLALNTLSAVLSGFAAAALFLLLRGLGLSRNRALLGSAAALMTPVAFGASVQSMDYIWALAPGLGALAAAVYGRPLLGGILLGLAMAARLTTVVFAVPALLLLPERSVRNLLRASSATLVVAFVAYALPLQNFGLNLFWFDDASVPFRLAFQRATLDVWGPLGLIALGVGGVCLLVIPRRRPLWHRHDVGALAAGLALVLVSYLRLPLEGGYLLPAVPLVVGIFAVLLRRVPFAGVCGLLIASPFLFDLESVDVVPPRMHVLAAGPGPIRLLAEGPVTVDRARMHLRARTSTHILETADQLGAGTGLNVGTSLPEAVMAGWRRPEKAPEAWLLLDGFPLRPYPGRTADEVLMLSLNRPLPRHIVEYRRTEAEEHERP